MKHLKFIITFLILLNSSIIKAQTELDKDFYTSVEFTYRSYGKGDIIGFGGGIEYSKDLKKWLGAGLNISFWNNKRKSWDFVNPFTSQRYIFIDQIKEVKISPFIQIIPINTTYFDFYVQLGVSSGHYNQNFYTGGYMTTYDPIHFEVFVEDEGYKGVYFATDIGIAMRFQFNNIIIIPNMLKSFNSQAEDGFDSLNLKIGWNF